MPRLPTPDSRSVKVNTNWALTSYHISDGAYTFAYAVDAHMAALEHPLEWKLTAWTDAEANAAFAERAKADMPAPKAPAPLSAEEQEANDAHAKMVAEADARLREFHERKNREHQEVRQIEEDEVTVASIPPVRRPVRVKPKAAVKRTESNAQRRRRIATEDDEPVTEEST